MTRHRKYQSFFFKYLRTDTYTDKQALLLKYLWYLQKTSSTNKQYEYRISDTFCIDSRFFNFCNSFSQSHIYYKNWIKAFILYQIYKVAITKIENGRLLVISNYFPPWSLIPPIPRWSPKRTPMQSPSSWGLMAKTWVVSLCFIQLDYTCIVSFYLGFCVKP